jgi:hypothetical protein
MVSACPKCCRRRIGLTLWLCLAVTCLHAQNEKKAPPANAKAAAPIDFTGQWVSVVTEDWRWRMVTPSKGDFTSVPLNEAGQRIGDAWDPAKDEAAGLQCKAYAAPNILRMPERLRISWADDDTLKLETDTGMQTRMLYFKEPKSKGGDWQGVSQASWELTTGYNFFSVMGIDNNVQSGRQAAGQRVRKPTSSLSVVTTNIRPGYIRKNGVPFSDKAVLTEYFDRTNESNGDSWLVVTSILDDPVYLNQPFVITTQFQKQADESGWDPTPCRAR